MTLAAVVLVLVFAVEPVVAKKGAGRNRGTTKTAQKSRQVSRSSVSRAGQRPASVSRSRSRSVNAGSVRSRSASRISKTLANRRSSPIIKRRSSPIINRRSSSSIKRTVSVHRPVISTNRSSRKRVSSSLVGKRTSAMITTRKVARSAKPKVSVSSKVQNLRSKVFKKPATAIRQRQHKSATKPKVSINRKVQNLRSKVFKKPATVIRQRQHKSATKPKVSINRKVQNLRSKVFKKPATVIRQRQAKSTTKPKQTIRKVIAKREGGPKAKREPIAGGRIGARSSRRASPPKSRVAKERLHVKEKGIKRQRDVVRNTGTRQQRNARRPRVIYEERSRAVRRSRRHEHVYRDFRGRLCHRIIWPRYRFRVSYGWGPFFSFRYVYPYYHRKYVFVSLGGYWPIGYTYARYYRYGCHPYWWYGYHPVAREVRGDTHNYYTYNYYNGESGQGVSIEGPSESEAVISPQAEEPAPESLADGYFEKGVEAFEAGDYYAASESFAEACRLEPDDMILPFAYSQALLATEQYTKAADILRIALLKTPDDSQGVFYPRGLYSNEDILSEQIERLSTKANEDISNSDLQLLLGYQLLGVGRLDEAGEPLRQARLEQVNTGAADILLELLLKIRVEEP